MTLGWFARYTESDIGGVMLNYIVVIMGIVMILAIPALWVAESNNQPVVVELPPKSCVTGSMR
jgi:hypothetical protein